MPDSQVRRRLETVAVAIGVLLGILWLFKISRGSTFFHDDWEFILYRRTGIRPFLEPHNGHFSVVPVALYRTLFALVGLRVHDWYQAVGLGLHGALVTALFLYARSRVGPALALAGAGLFLFFGAAEQVLLWPFANVYFSVPCLCLLGVLYLADLDRPEADAGASGLVAVALAGSGLGAPIALGLSVELAVRRRWRRLWVTAAPAVLFAAWAVAYGDSGIQLGRVVRIPEWIARGAAGALGGLAGVGTTWGFALLVPAVILLGARALRRPGLPPRAIHLIATLVTIWVAIAVTRRGGDATAPDASRYLYATGLISLLLAFELLRGVRVPPVILAVVAVGAAAAVAAGLGSIRAAAEARSAGATAARAQLGVLEMLRPAVPVGYRPDAPLLYRPAFVWSADRYFEAVDALGSPAIPAGQLHLTTPYAREAADRTLMDLLDVRVEPGPRADRPFPVPELESLEGARTEVRDGCLVVRPEGDEGRVEIAGGRGLSVDPEGVWTASARFLGDAYGPRDLPGASAGVLGVIGLPAVPAEGRWHVLITIRDSATICGRSG